MDESDFFYRKAKRMTRELSAKENCLKQAANQELEKLARKLQEEFKASSEGVNEALLVAAQSKSDQLRYCKRISRPYRLNKLTIRLLCPVMSTGSNKK